MNDFVEVIDPNGPTSYQSYVTGTGRCDYDRTYTARWRNFYDTTLDLDYLNDSGTFLKFNDQRDGTPNSSGIFRWEIYSNNPLDIDGIRQLYYLELTASISIDDMNPVYSDTQTITLIVQNGCLNDYITNTGDYDGVYTTSNGKIPDNSANEYIYYINEATQNTPDNW